MFLFPCSSPLHFFPRVLLIYLCCACACASACCSYEGVGFRLRIPFGLMYFQMGGSTTN